MIASELQFFDDSAPLVVQAVREASETLYGQGDLDVADELLDAHLPYGTVAYFSQATKNARARARVASTYRELERVEDYHDELHDYLQWHKRSGTRLANESERQWAYHAKGQASMKDGDIFWPIAKTLCRIEGPEAGLDYVESHTAVHDSFISAIALNAIYRTAFEQRVPMPARAKQLATRILDRLEINPISAELDQRILLAHGYGVPMRSFPIGNMTVSKPMPYAEMLWQLQ